MANKRPKPEGIVSKLRQFEVLMQQVYGIDLPISKVPTASLPFVLPQAMRKRLEA
ncbi:hypothetical protein [Ruegeria hyattellae]|uniref:hypothetical protein n=1 Tax=Ruegeria hyattellae TaxID=3233337 RepID=UPI00355C3C8C